MRSYRVSWYGGYHTVKCTYLGWTCTRTCTLQLHYISKHVRPTLSECNFEVVSLLNAITSKGSFASKFPSFKCITRDDVWKLWVQTVIACDLSHRKTLDRHLNNILRLLFADKYKLIAFPFTYCLKVRNISNLWILRHDWRANKRVRKGSRGYNLHPISLKFGILSGFYHSLDKFW